MSARLNVRGVQYTFIKLKMTRFEIMCTHEKHAAADAQRSPEFSVEN